MGNYTEKRKGVRLASKKIVVLYHGGCNDGFGGAWAAWKKFGNRAEYVSLHRDDAVPDLRGKELYFIDYLYMPEVMAKFMKNNKKVVGLDHHVTTADSVKLLGHGSVYSVKNSGAVLAWEYFHPGKKVPLLLRYIEDRDTWRWKMPKAREILAGTNFSEENSYTFKGFGKLVADFEKPSFRKQCIADGKIVYSVWEGLIRNSLSELAEPVKLDGVKALAVNSPHVFSSRLGHFLVSERDVPLAIIWYAQGGIVRVSLRSDGKADCAKIAQKYGGGGHKAAAGFLIRGLKNIPWHSIKR